MFTTLIVNFSLIFAFTIFVFWPKLHPDKNPLIKKIPPLLNNIIVGVKFGIVGLLLGYISLNYLNGILYNARIIFVLFSGIIGGPLAVLISGIMMILGRFILFDITPFSIYMSVNAAVILLFTGYYAHKYRIRFENIPIYLAFILVELSIFIMFYFNFSVDSLKMMLLMVVFTWVTFKAIYWILIQSEATSGQAMQMMAMKQVDFLTQLPNNYAIDAYLKHALFHYRTFSYLHIDIDHFKQYNNKYSYLIGDHILGEMSEIIKKYAEEHNGFAGRIGGEEFCYIMKETPPAIAIYEANTIRNLIETHNFGYTDSLKLDVTVSIGISTFPDNGITLEKIYQSADTALQTSKKMSGNQVYHYNQYLKDIQHSHF